MKYKGGEKTSHSYWSWTHGPRWTTHGTSGRRPWDGWVPGGDSSLQQGAGTTSPCSPDLEMAMAAVQRGDWEKDFDIRGFLHEGNI